MATKRATPPTVRIRSFWLRDILPSTGDSGV
jgi:hypothetical protein